MTRKVLLAERSRVIRRLEMGREYLRGLLPIRRNIGNVFLNPVGRVLIGHDIDHHRPVHGKRARQQLLQLARLVDAKARAAERLGNLRKIDGFLKAPDLAGAAVRLA